MMLVLGTTNASKQQELAALLEPFHIECRSLKDFASAVRVAETGNTFADNAALKAIQQAQALNHWVLAEDSGLVVEALDGSPGVYSARFAGPEASDDDNNALLIEQLTDVPSSRRIAYYACHATLAAPDKKKHHRGRYGLEPAVPGSVGRCLNHWATGPYRTCAKGPFH